MDNAARKVQLEAWIAKSQVARRRVVIGGAVSAVVGLVVAVAINGVVGAVLATGAVAFALCGAWITTGHILSFKGDIRDLAAGRFEPQTIHVKQGRGRYQR